MILTELYSFFVNTLIGALISSFVLIIWFETNALVEYGRLLAFKFKDYSFQENIGISFPDYLAATHSDSFLVRLITCPICLGVWLGIIFGIIFDNPYIIFSVFYLSLIMYFLFKIIMLKSDESKEM